MYNFLGNIRVKVDAKGRLFVPASYRRSLEQSSESVLYLEWSETNKSVKIYPESVWNKLSEELRSKLNLWDEKDRKIYRQYTSRVEQAELDSMGRALIPRKHLRQGEMETDALVVGAGEHFELWNETNFEGSLYSEEDFDKVIQEKMGNNPNRLF